jgi:hypothetical protein
MVVAYVQTKHVTFTVRFPETMADQETVSSRPTSIEKIFDPLCLVSINIQHGSLGRDEVSIAASWRRRHEPSIFQE